MLDSLAMSDIIKIDFMKFEMMGCIKFWWIRGGKK